MPHALTLPQEKLCRRKGTLTVCSAPSKYAPGGWMFDARSSDGRRLGALELKPIDEGRGRPKFEVDVVSVLHEVDAGRGIGTALYESAAEYVCGIGGLLVSSPYRSTFSEAFWRKQADKGRARCLRRASYPGKSGIFNAPVAMLANKLDPEVYAALMQKMPKASGAVWPCARWVLKRRGVCRAEGVVLSGLRDSVPARRVSFDQIFTR